MSPGGSPSEQHEIDPGDPRLLQRVSPVGDQPIRDPINALVRALHCLPARRTSSRLRRGPLPASARAERCEAPRVQAEPRGQFRPDPSRDDIHSAAEARAARGRDRLAVPPKGPPRRRTDQQGCRASPRGARAHCRDRGHVGVGRVGLLDAVRDARLHRRLRRDLPRRATHPNGGRSAYSSDASARSLSWKRAVG